MGAPCYFESLKKKKKSLRKSEVWGVQQVARGYTAVPGIGTPGSQCVLGARVLPTPPAQLSLA